MTTTPVTMTEALGRIQQIQSTLSRLGPVRSAGAGEPGTTAAGGSGSSGSSSAAAFADELAALDSARSTAEGTLAAIDAALAPPAPAEPEVPATPESVTGEDIVAAARKYIGVPYVWGGTDESGMDCSGFVQRVFADLGIEMPRMVRDQIAKGTEVESFAEARPGDLISSLNGAHIAIYLGDGKAIDAPVPGQSVAVRGAWEMKQNLHRIVRIVPEAEAAGPAADAGAAGSGRTSDDASAADLVTAARAALERGGW